MIVFSSVSKEYGGRKVVDGVSFSIKPGEFVCITGPSGAGKSTLIHLMIRADMPTSGSIEVDGADITRLPIPVLQVYRRRMGVVFQDYKLLMDRTVGENVALPLELGGLSDAEVAEKVEKVLSELKLSDQRDLFPTELSGGEKTRTALARAMIHEPTILIADEPTGNIDPKQSMEIIDLLKKINQRGTTVILASHDRLVVDAVNSRVLRLEDGKIVGDWVGGYVGGEIKKVPEPPKETEHGSVHHHAVHHHASPVHHAGHSHSAEHHKVKPVQT